MIRPSLAQSSPFSHQSRSAQLTCITITSNITSSVASPEKVSQTTRQTYPNYKVIVLNDDINTFEHVAQALIKHIPNMLPDRAWKLTEQVHFEGQAIVWSGPLEQAELYHLQLCVEGLTMAPLEAS